MIAMSFFGTWIGKYAMDRIPERTFRIGLQAMLAFLGLRLIWLAVDASLILS